MNHNHLSWIGLILVLWVGFVHGFATRPTSHQHHHHHQRRQRSESNVVAEMQVVCRSDSILLKVETNSPFNGIIYAKDAPSGADCVSEFNSSTNMTYKLPLKSCGTLFAEADDGIEYFNTIIVQPHVRLMTNQGRGYHIRCKYQTRERTIANTHFNVSASFPMQNNPAQSTTMPLLATASMPSCTMKIFRSGRDDVAEAVKIGDKLIMVIEIDQQDMYGMKITNCVVRDGMNVAEQQLINDAGCPIDENIMPRFEYTNNYTRAAVSFPAHKFPHTSSVYYQCNVRLCINNGGCTASECNPASGDNSPPAGGPRRRKRMAHDDAGESPDLTAHDAAAAAAAAADVDTRASSNPTSNKAELSFDVYSGLYVSDLDVGGSGSSDSSAVPMPPPPPPPATTSAKSAQRGAICLTLGQAMPIIMFGGLALIATAFMLLCQIGLLGRARDHQQVGNRDHQQQQRRRRLAHESRHREPPYQCYNSEMKA